MAQKPAPGEDEEHIAGYNEVSNIIKDQFNSQKLNPTHTATTSVVSSQLQTDEDDDPKLAAQIQKQEARLVT